jgi:hypothetical protein
VTNTVAQNRSIALLYAPLLGCKERVVNSAKVVGGCSKVEHHLGGKSKCGKSLLKNCDQLVEKRKLCANSIVVVNQFHTKDDRGREVRAFKRADRDLVVLKDGVVKVRYAQAARLKLA